MNKQEIIKIIDREYKRTCNPYWLQIKGKLKKLDNLQVLTGLTRYINAISRTDLHLDAACFHEIIEDAKLNQFIWQVVDKDLARLNTKKRAKSDKLEMLG